MALKSFNRFKDMMLVGWYECKGGKRAVQVSDAGAGCSAGTHGSGNEGLQQMEPGGWQTINKPTRIASVTLLT